MAMNNAMTWLLCCSTFPPEKCPLPKLSSVGSADPCVGEIGAFYRTVMGVLRIEDWRKKPRIAGRRLRQVRTGASATPAKPKTRW